MARAVELKNEYRKENILLIKAIKDKCVECLCSQKIDCEINDCGLYKYRPYGVRVAKTKTNQSVSKNRA